MPTVQESEPSAGVAYRFTVVLPEEGGIIAPDVGDLVEVAPKPEARMSTQLEFLKQLEKQEVAPQFDIWLDAVAADRTAHPEQWQGLRCAESSYLHGRRHWTRVACLGLAMLRGEGGHWSPVEQPVLERRFLLSAFFHDIGRLDEGRDAGHAARGERVFRFVAPALSVHPDDVESVAVAIRNHASGPAVLSGADLVAACVADADRLDRARLWEHPLPACMYPELPWEKWEGAAWRWGTGDDWSRG